MPAMPEHEDALPVRPAAQARKNSGNVTGDALDAQVERAYFPWQRFGFSLRYNHHDVDLDFERARFDGNVNLNIRGRSGWPVPRRNIGAVGDPPTAECEALRTPPHRRSRSGRDGRHPC